MQFMSGIVKDFGIYGKEFDLMKFLEVGVKYMGLFFQRYGGDLQKVLIVYNWGMGNFEKKGMVNVFEEVRNYVFQIILRMQVLQCYLYQVGLVIGGGGINIIFQNIIIKIELRILDSLVKEVVNKGMVQSSFI